MITRAPGKLMLLGEYAVLEGGPALIAAVDRFATARRTPAEATTFSSDPAVPDYAFAEALALPPAAYHVDTRALGVEQQGWQKLGLGSSAASTVALAAMETIDPEEIFARAHAAHREVQGTGSGADIAASAFGGVISYRWWADAEAAPEHAFEAAGGAASVRPMDWDAPLLCVWTGQPASTPDLVASVQAVRAREPNLYADLIGRIAAAAERGIAAMAAGDRFELCRAAGDTTNALLYLDSAAGVRLVTVPMLELQGLVGDDCAIAKPTGAGGGDLCWVLAPDLETEVALAKELRERGLSVHRLKIARSGARRIEA